MKPSLMILSGYKKIHSTFQKKQGFTMAELIVSIAILAILSTISYVLYTGNINTSRDATRLSNIKTLYSGAKSLVANNTKIPFPDRGIALQASGVHIGYQGYVGARQSIDMGFDSANYQDPQDQQAYTYRINKNRDKGQFLTYLENKKYGNTASILFIDNAYAAQDYSAKYPYTIGDPLGVIILSGSQAPAQEDALTANGGIPVPNPVNISEFSGDTVNITKNNSNLSIVDEAGVKSGVITKNDITSLQNESYNMSGKATFGAPNRKNIDVSSTTCGLIDGKVKCWGRGTGQFGNIITIPLDQPTMVSVSVGGFGNNASGACGLSNTGGLTCWSGRDPYQASGISSTGAIESFDLGENFGCAIIASNKQVKCWSGGATAGYPPANLSAKQVSGGFDSSCAITLSGSVACWGDNSYGQTNPPIAPGKIATSVQVGYQNACSTYDDGSVACWGRDANTKLALSSSITGALAIELGSSYGRSRACVYGASGDIRCWGDDISGIKEIDGSAISGNIAMDYAGLQGKIGNLYYSLPLENISAANSQILLRPSGDLENLKSVEIGNYISCGIRQDDGFTCWGDGQGLRYLTGSLVNAKVLQVESGGTPGACVLKSDFSIACFGTNTHGEYTPPSVVGGFKQISMGDYYACGVTRLNGEVRCWGQNANTSAKAPTSITGAKKVIAGMGVGCAIKSDDTIGCWGWNNYGSATPPAGLTNVMDLVGIQGDYCALTYSGSISCWGQNPHGQRNVPINLKPSSKIAHGYFHSCALHTDGDVTCWGQLGGRPQGTTSLPALSGVSELILGAETTCGLRGSLLQNLECTGTYAR